MVKKMEFGKGGMRMENWNQNNDTKMMKHGKGHDIQRQSKGWKE